MSDKDKKTIREIIKVFSNNEEPSLELCERFAILYKSSFTERMTLLSKYLKSGKLTEALSLAETGYDLKQLCLDLHFSSLKRCLKFCEEKLGTSIDVLDIDKSLKIIDKLYSNPQILEPLIATYRKFLMVGSNEEKLQTLRRIIKLDPDKNTWKEAAMPLEKEYLASTLKRFKEYKLSNDFNGIQQVRNEIIHEVWQMELPTELKEKIELTYKESKESFYLELAQSSIDNLKTNQIEEDPLKFLDQVSLIETYIKKSQGLEASRREKFIKIKQFVFKARDKKQHEEKFDLALKELQTLIEAPTSKRHDLEVKLDKVRKFDLSIPDRLDVRALNRIEDCHLQEKRKARFRLGMIFASVAVITLIISIMVIYHQREEERKAVILQLQVMLEKDTIPEAFALYKKAVVPHEYLNTNPELLALQAKFEQRRKEIQKNLDDFLAAKGELISLKENNFQAKEENQVYLKIEAAKKLAKRQEDQLYVEEFEADFKARQDKIRLAAQMKFADLCEKISSELRNEDSFDQASVEEGKERISKVKLLRIQAQAQTKFIDKDLLTQLDDFNKSAISIEQKLLERELRIKESKALFVTAIERIKGGKVDLEKYLSDAQKLKELRPKIADYKQLNKDLKRVQDVEMLKTSPPVPQLIIQHKVDKASIWYSDLEDLRKLVANYSQEKRELLSFLNKQEFNSLYLYSMKKTKPSNSKLEYYYAYKPAKPVEKKINYENEKRDAYELHALTEKNNKAVVRVRYIIKGVHASEDGYVEFKRDGYVKFQKEPAHIKYFAKKTYMDLAKMENITRKFYKAYVKTILNDEAVEPVVKVMLLKRCLSLLRTLTPELQVDYQKLEQLLSSVDLGTCVWLDKNSEKTKAINQKINKDILPEVPLCINWEDVLNNHEKILQHKFKLFSRAYEFAGIIEMQNKSFMPYLKNKDYFELYITYMEDGKLLFLRIAEKKGEEFIFHPAINTLWYPGMPVMGVKSKESCEDLREEAENLGLELDILPVK